jgi:hypothetical protein
MLLLIYDNSNQSICCICYRYDSNRNSRSQVRRLAERLTGGLKTGAAAVSIVSDIGQHQ